MDDKELKNKRRFFALYMDQEVLNINGNDIVDGRCFYSANRVEEGFLELKSLSDISDEDLIYIATLLSKTPFEEKHRAEVQSNKQDFISVVMGEQGFDTGWSFSDYQHIIDYLRSQSYLLPYGDLTVEQILEYKWAVIKSNEKQS